MRTLFTKVVFLLACVPAAELRAQPALEDYIREGLKNNLVLQQKSIELDKALLALKIANGMFMPTVALQANYTSGEGGRSISVPVGDLMNPVYRTLNQLTQSDQFPEIQNVEQNFFPYNFYDAKVHTTLPIVNTNLVYNKKIRQHQVLLQEFEVDTYKRELVRNIKVAYYNYLSAHKAIDIYRAALTRAQESKRVNESLLKNGKGLAAYILRSQSEIEQVTTQITEAEKQAQNAQLYFNFLLNRESEEPVVTGNISVTETSNPEELSGEISTQQREELKQLREATALRKEELALHRLFSSPKLNGFLDLGSQAQDWQFNDKSRYYLVGVQLEVPLFAGLTNRHRIHQAGLDVKNSELHQSLVARQLNMSARVSHNAVVTALQSHHSALKQLEAATSYQRLIERGYKEGVNTFIEAVDARSQLTSAQLLATLSQYKVLIARANYERETASYEFNN